jgi:hypothetical protein
MRTIWQYPIPTGQGLGGVEPFELMLPVGAKFLAIERNGMAEPSLYFEVDRDAKMEPRRFVYLPTGATLPAWALRYLGTFAILPYRFEGRLVFHVYEAA